MLSQMQVGLRSRNISDSVATHGLDGLGFKSQWGEIFQTRPDRL
jgi:hypothetical protein